MARAIIVTVGVSLIKDYITEREGRRVGFEKLPSPVLNLCGLDHELGKADSRHASEAEGATFNPAESLWGHTRDQMVAALDHIGADPTLKLTPMQRQQYLGAELASLKRLGGDEGAVTPDGEQFIKRPWERPLATDDEIILLATDTAPGIFCAGVIQQVLREGRAGFPPVVEARIVIAHGLRPESRELFLAAGLPGAAQILFETCRAHSETLLVGSGGYKGLLPYLAPVAMHLGVPLVYLYEESSKLLTIQPLPMTLDVRVLKNNESAFEKLAPVPGQSQRPTCAEKLFWLPIRRQHPEDEESIRAWGWVEPTDTRGELRLSATGVLAWLLAYHGYRPARAVDAAPADG